MAVTISFSPTLEEVNRRFSNIDVPGFLKDKIQEIAFLVEAGSKRVTPVKTGRLRASIYTTLGDMGMKATVQPNTNYAIYVHEGTKYMRGRPFMYWGALSAVTGLDAEVARDLEQDIQRKIR